MNTQDIQDVIDLQAILTGTGLGDSAEFIAALMNWKHNTLPVPATPKGKGSKNDTVDESF